MQTLCRTIMLILYSVNSHPNGFPQVAAFLNSDDSFVIFRRFGRTSCRLLLHLQAQIHRLEKELDDLDSADASPGSTTSYRLLTSEHRPEYDTKQIELFQQLQEKVLIYRMNLVYITIIETT